MKEIDFTHDVMEEGHNFNSTVLITLKFQESRAGEELSTLGRQQSGYIYELVIVDALGPIFRK